MWDYNGQEKITIMDEKHRWGSNEVEQWLQDYNAVHQCCLLELGSPLRDDLKEAAS
jgi:acyl-coenzyme A synthetase/AMP-(fatty) acid ligase